MIIVIEGPDGVGKTTLARALADELHGSVIHGYYDKSWNMLEYHLSLLSCARALSKYKPVVLDRWAPSEYVYGKVFRTKESFDTWKLISLAAEMKDLRFIYCRNDNTAQNHLKNKEGRHEMFDDMTAVTEEYDEYVDNTPELNWSVFDFDKIKVEDFITNFTKKELNNEKT